MAATVQHQVGLDLVLECLLDHFLSSQTHRETLKHYGNATNKSSAKCTCPPTPAARLSDLKAVGFSFFFSVSCFIVLLHLRGRPLEHGATRARVFEQFPWLFAASSSAPPTPEPTCR